MEGRCFFCKSITTIGWAVRERPKENAKEISPWIKSCGPCAAANHEDFIEFVEAEAVWKVASQPSGT